MWNVFSSIFVVLFVWLCFGGDKTILVGYSNSNIAGGINSQKSTSCYMIKFAWGVAAWKYRLQECVTLSTNEENFISITESCKNLLWMNIFLEEFDFVQDKYILLESNFS